MKLIKKMKAMGWSLALLKLTGYEGEYTCAYRRKKAGQELYMEKSGTKENDFILLPYSKDYWYADPLIYCYQGDEVVFMEAYEKKSGLGRIAYSRIQSGEWTPPEIIISEDFHMSFPTIFEYRGQIYMLPETSRANCMILYRCISFPEKWEKAGEFFKGYDIVDTVLVSEQENGLLFLSSQCDPENDLRSRFFSFKLSIADDGRLQAIENREYNKFQEYTYESRNAGGILRLSEGKCILPIQTSTAAVYGYSVKYVTIDHRLRRGACLREVRPENTDVNLSHVIGIHTYSTDDIYEVIDIQYMRFHADKWMKRISSRLRKK